MATGAVVTSNGKNLMLKRMLGTTVTAVSQFKIGTGTTTPSNSDTDVETVIAAWNGGSDYGTFTSGYPVYDTTNNKVTIRGFVGATQANGNTVTENGLFNSDGTPLMLSHDVHAGVAKTTSVQLSIVWVYQLTD